MERSLEVVQGKVFDVIGVADAVIAEMAEKYLPLKINGIDDKAGFKKVHEARMVVKDSRVKVEKKRKELKEDALRYGQAIDKEANRIKGLLEPIETHLDTEEGKIKAEQDRIKAEAEAKEAARLQARADTICAFGATFNGQTYTAYGLQFPVALVKACTDEQFNQFIAQVQAAKDAEDARIKAEEDARKAEAERLAKIAAEQEAERQRLAEVARKQAEDAARIKAEQEAAQRKANEEKERIAKEQADREAKIKADMEALEAEKKRVADAEAARLKAIEDEKRKAEEAKALAERIERERKEAAEKAVKDAAEKAEREAKEKAAREEAARIKEEKRIARQPDKEKLFLFANSLNGLPLPEMKTAEGKTTLGQFKEELACAIHNLRANAEAL